MADRGVRLSVAMEQSVGEDEILGVRQALADAGLGEVSVNAGITAELFLPARGGGGPPAPSAGEIAWIVFILAPTVRLFLEEAAKSAAQALGKSVASNGYDALRTLIRRVHERRSTSRKEDGDVLLRGGDKSGKVMVAILDPDLPDEAYEKLKELDVMNDILAKEPELLKVQRIAYDRESGSWKASSRQIRL